MRIVSAWWDGEKINCVNNSKHNPCNESSWKIKYHSSWVHILPFNSKCSALECKIRKLLHVYSYYPPHSIYSAIKPFNIHAYFPGLVRRICRREFPDHGLLQTFVRTIFFAGLGRGVSGKGREVDVIILTCLPRFLNKKCDSQNFFTMFLTLFRHCACVAPWSWDSITWLAIWVVLARRAARKTLLNSWDHL